jgi:hypothetical protein
LLVLCIVSAWCRRICVEQVADAAVPSACFEYVAAVRHLTHLWTARCSPFPEQALVTGQVHPGDRHVPRLLSCVGTVSMIAASAAHLLLLLLVSRSSAGPVLLLSCIVCDFVPQKGNLWLLYDACASTPLIASHSTDSTRHTQCPQKHVSSTAVPLHHTANTKQTVHRHFCPYTRSCVSKTISERLQSSLTAVQPVLCWHSCLPISKPP